MLLTSVQVIESIFYMWRATHDRKWRDMGWQMWRAIEHYARWEGGYSGAHNADQVGACLGRCDHRKMGRRPAAVSQFAACEAHAHPLNTTCDCCCLPAFQLPRALATPTCLREAVQPIQLRTS